MKGRKNSHWKELTAERLLAAQGCLLTPSADRRAVAFSTVVRISSAVLVTQLFGKQSYLAPPKGSRNKMSEAAPRDGCPALFMSLP